MDENEFTQVVEEAVDRLNTGVAEDVDDVVEQLDDEGLTYSQDQKSALTRALEIRGFG